DEVKNSIWRIANQTSYRSELTVDNVRTRKSSYRLDLLPLVRQSAGSLIVRGNHSYLIQAQTIWRKFPGARRGFDMPTRGLELGSQKSSHRLAFRAHWNHQLPR